MNSRGGSSGSSDGGVSGKGFARSAKLNSPSARITGRMYGRSIEISLKLAPTRQRLDSSRFTSSFSKLASGAPSASGKLNPSTPSSKVNGLKRISPISTSRP